MTTTYTFVNPVAARLFADKYWPSQSRTATTLQGSTVSLIPRSQRMAERLRIAAEAFNAASQKAREIGEGDE